MLVAIWDTSPMTARMMVSCLANNHLTMNKNKGEITKKLEALEAKPTFVWRRRMVKLNSMVYGTAV